MNVNFIRINFIIASFIIVFTQFTCKSASYAGQYPGQPPERSIIHTREELELTKLPPLINVPPCRPGELPVFVNAEAINRGKYGERRSIVRETWLDEIKRTKSSLRVIFVMGKPSPNKLESWQDQVNQESIKYQDILQFDFVDNFYNRTLKHLSWMHWALNNCNSSEYILKLNDDILLNVKRMEEKMKNHSFEHGITGIIYASQQVIREENNAWFVPEYVYLDNVYMPYLSGSFYILSSDIIKPLYEVAINQREEPVLDIDDIYITGISAKLANISIHNSVEFFQKIDRYCSSDIYQLPKASAYDGLYSDQCMRKLFKRWKKLENKEETSKPVLTSSKIDSPTTTTTTTAPSVSIKSASHEKRDYLIPSDYLIPRGYELIAIIFLILFVILLLIRRLFRYAFSHALLPIHSIWSTIGTSESSKIVR
jgi:hypothetical protein